MVAKHIAHDTEQGSSDALRITSESCTSPQRLRLRRWAPNIVLSVLVFLALATVLVLVVLVVTRKTNNEGPRTSSSPSKVEPQKIGSFPCTLKEGYYMYSDDCKRFYHCANGSGTMFRCGDNLIWSQTASSCVDYDPDLCASPSSTVVTTKAPIVTRSTSNLWSKFTKTSRGPSRCATPNGLFANLQDCTSFYSCLEGRVQTMMTCPNGRMWSQRHMYCVDFDPAQCLTIGQRTIVDNSTPPPKGKHKSAPPYVCDRAPVWIPLEMDCRKFIVCREVGAYGSHFECARGSVWRQSELACVLETTEDALRCGILSHPSAAPSVSSRTTITSLLSVVTSRPEDTALQSTANSFVSPSRVLRLSSTTSNSRTDRTKATLQPRNQMNSGLPETSIPIRTSHEVTERTRTPGIPGGDSNSSNIPDMSCKENGFWAHPTDCRKFLMCIHDADSGTVLTCPSHTMWSQDSYACVTYDVDGCQDNLMAVRTTPSTVKSTNPSFICSSTGKFSAPNSCRKYVICYRAGLQGYYVDCPSGLVWNNEKAMCYPFEINLCQD